MKICLVLLSLFMVSCEKEANRVGRQVGRTAESFASGAMQGPLDRLDQSRKEVEKRSALQRKEAEERAQMERDRLANEKALRDSLPNGPRR